MKNMDPEKHRMNMGVKNMSALIKKMRNVICSLKACVLTSMSKLNFSG